MQLTNIAPTSAIITTSTTTNNYNLTFLLALNISLFVLHIEHNCKDVYYFFQLTILGQILVIFNFLLSIVLHERKSGPEVRKFLSRFHLMGIGLEAVIALGFWGLRIFFTRGILKQGEVMSTYTEILSIWVHGGNFLTMFYFIKTDQIIMQQNKRIKYIIHLFWGIPFVLIQYLRWALSGQHVYGFLKQFTWVQLVVFEVGLYQIAVGVDYMLSIRHGLKLTIGHINAENKNIDQLEKEKQEKQRQLAIREEEKQKQIRNKISKKLS